jgi:O-phospho-L-seryl-tRNASec:L-selenocysteinyl-tRNA synthase
MVPVGGAVVASNNPALLQHLSSTYPGRASVAPIMDLFITLLSMGELGYQQLLDERRRLLPIFGNKLQLLASQYNLTMISSPRNTISFAIGIDNLPSIEKGFSFLGSMLFQRSVSGCRVVTSNGKLSVIADVSFQNWGSHHNAFPHNYFTAACAIGMRLEEIDCFIDRLEKVLQKYIKINTTVPVGTSPDIESSVSDVM